MSLTWLYAVAGPDAEAWQPPARGIAGAQVGVVCGEGLCAIVSEVSEDEYGQGAIDRAVTEATWLEPRATAHQAVNAAAHAALEAVLPVPFATIYRDADPVREMLRSRSDELAARLRALRGGAEWVVALYRDTPAAAAHLDTLRSRTGAEPVAAGAGRQYLESRKAASSQREALRGLDQEASAGARHLIERVTRTGFDEPVLDDAGDLVSRATYLVRSEDAPRLRATLERFNADWADRGYELRATGPWPPYRSSREGA